MYLSIVPSTYLSPHLPIYLPTYLSIHPSIHLSIYLSLCLSVCLSTWLSASLKTQLFCETSSGFELDNIKNGAILRDFLNVWTWQRQKRSNSARCLHFSKLTTSKPEQFLRDFLNFWTWQRQKRNNSARLLHFSNLRTFSITKQFCETSSFFELNNVKSETILRSFKNGKLSAAADGLVPMRFAIFPFHLSKVLRLSRKIDARSYEVLHLSRKIIFPKLKIWGSKMQPLSGNQRPDLLTSLMNMSFVLHLPHEMHLCRSSSNVPRLPSFLEMLQNPHVLLTFEKVHNPLRLPRETTSERPKVVRTPGAFNILTSKCASRIFTP